MTLTTTTMGMVRTWPPRRSLRSGQRLVRVWVLLRNRQARHFSGRGAATVDGRGLCCGLAEAAATSTGAAAAHSPSPGQLSRR